MSVDSSSHGAGSPDAASPDAGSPGARRSVLVRYFAGAAAAAGTEEETVPAAPATVGALLELLATTRGGDLGRVLAASSFLLQGVAARREDLLPDGAVLDVLPPFAGG